MNLHSVGASVATLLVLGVLGAEKLVLEPPVRQVEAFQARVRAAVADMPRCIGPWLGVDVPLPQGAMRLLTPNAVISRQFTEDDTGEAFTFLFIEVGDSRDILGHYPPVCYKAQGWTEESSTPMDWPAWGTTAHGMEYSFGRNRLEGPASFVVDNFLFLPNCSTYRDMTEMKNQSTNRLYWGMGGGQVQFIFDPGISRQRRNEIVQSFLKAMSPVFDAMRLGKSYK
jgi:Protein of unknown function (DUF3485)